MNDLLDRIYREIIYFEDDAVQMEGELADEIEGLLEQYCRRSADKQMMEFRAVIYEAVFSAESKAFWLGVKYAVRLIEKL